MSASFHLTGQPGFRNVPFAFHSGARKTQHIADFLDRKTSEETHFDNAALLLVDLRKLVEGLVERHQFGASLLANNQRRIEVNFDFCTALRGGVASSIVHQNLAHQLRCDRQEMSAAFGFKGLLIEKAKVSLMNKCGTLQRVSRTFALQVIVRDLSQLPVDNRDQPFQGVLIACPPTNE
jgi:hypothetical protein